MFGGFDREADWVENETEIFETFSTSPGGNHEKPGTQTKK